jgi:hypothetical protein
MFGILYQYHEYQAIQDFSKKPKEKKYPVFLFIETMTVAAGVVGFGRPYGPLAVSLISIVCLFFVDLEVPPVVDCFEKTSLLFTLISVVIEYTYYVWVEHEENSID